MGLAFSIWADCNNIGISKDNTYKTVCGFELEDGIKIPAGTSVVVEKYEIEEGDPLVLVRTLAPFESQRQRFYVCPHHLRALPPSRKLSMVLSEREGRVLIAFRCRLGV